MNKSNLKFARIVEFFQFVRGGFFHYGCCASEISHML